MSTPARLIGFAAGLAAVLVLGLVVGAAVGPVDDPVDAAASHGGHDGDSDGGTAAVENAVAPGLSASQDGYTLRLASPTHPLRRSAPLSFVVTAPDGRPLTEYTTAHEKDLHLIVVRRDGSGFQHLHPSLADDGTWSVPLTVRAAGAYKVFADLVPAGGDPVTLGAELSVAGPYDPQPLAGDVREHREGPYTVRLDGDVDAGAHSRLTLTVLRDGEPVEDLEQYLGAYGHLVTLRADDLAYLHVHPDGEPGDGRTAPGPEVVFDVEVPTDGAYRLYLDYQHRGTVRTATFTLWAGPAKAPAEGTGATEQPHDDGHGHDH